MSKFLLLIALVISLSGCGTVRSAKLYAPSLFGFSEINDGIYVDNQMSDNQRQEFLKTLGSSKERVSAFFGALEGLPKVFACSSEDCYVEHGGGTDKGRAFGDSMLLLSPRGLNAVITSHELTHIELHHRIGSFRSWRTIPAWFDEGLAVLVSEDPRYSDEAWINITNNGLNAPELKDIGRMLGRGDWLLVYGTARREVGRWYQSVGSSGLALLIAKVKDGNDFDSEFTNRLLQAPALGSPASNERNVD
jgi:hypothetical protein